MSETKPKKRKYHTSEATRLRDLSVTKDERNVAIAKRYYLDMKSMPEIALEFGLSTQRISAITTKYEDLIIKDLKLPKV